MNIKKILFLLSLCAAAYGAELPKPKIIILDYNNKQTIADVIQKPAIVGVFGATPRLSACDRYIKTVQQDFPSLRQKFDKNKKMKGVMGSTRAALATLAQAPGLAACQTFLDSASQSQLMQLFLDAGLNKKTLHTNAMTLAQTADAELKEKQSKKKPENLYLAHLLLPSYFTDVKKEDAPAMRVHTFLQQSAARYKTMYEACDPAMAVCIIIPPLDHFMVALDKGEELSPDDKLAINANVVQQDLIEQIGKDQGYVLLNQNGPELQPMVTYLQKLGTPRIGGAVIKIENAGRSGTVFNPYVLEPGKKYRDDNNPMFNDQFVEYLQHIRSREEKNDEK